jgi:hypothetical protein
VAADLDRAGPVATLLDIPVELWAAIVGGVIGAVVTAICTAVATSVISGRLERERRQQRLLSALEVVAVEVEENLNRLDRFHKEEVGDRLTLHDWVIHKPALAGLARDQDHGDLWRRLSDAYGLIHEARERAGRSPPDMNRLHDLKTQLTTLNDELPNDLAKLGGGRGGRSD